MMLAAGPLGDNQVMWVEPREEVSVFPSQGFKQLASAAWKRAVARTQPSPAATLISEFQPPEPLGINVCSVSH